MKLALLTESNFSQRMIVNLIEANPSFQLLEIYKEQFSTLEQFHYFREEHNIKVAIVSEARDDFKQVIGYLNDFDIGILVLTINGDYATLSDKITRYVDNRETDNRAYQAVGQSATDEQTKPVVEEKIVYKEKIVETPVYKTEYKSVPKKKIAFLNIWQGAGSTTIATNLARGLAEYGVDVGYIETPTENPYMFDYLQIGDKEALEDDFTYTDVAYELRHNPYVKLKESPYRYQDIDWYVNDSRRERVNYFTLDDFTRLFVSVTNDIQIYDLSNMLINHDMKDVLKHMDDVYVVIEPNPIKLDWLSEYEKDVDLHTEPSSERSLFLYLEALKEEGYTWSFILNKFDKKSKVKDFESQMPYEPFATIPPLDYTELAEMIWRSGFVYDNDQETYDDLFQPFYKALLPKDIASKKKKKKKWFGRKKAE